ncbi:MAG TPA: helix-turn-helix transcriptional regulator [Thermoanaerobaculia bacterium]|nr:helix-turn-helix transcriptional regulator [Thermoanaerobaculia bacterium]
MRRGKDEDQEEPVEPGALIAFIRWLKRWKQNRLAKEARMDPSRISRYESGEDVPHPATMERILKAGGLRFPLVAAIKSFIRLIRGALASPELAEPSFLGTERPPEDVKRAVWDIVERTIALARLELKVLWSLRESGRPALPTAADRERVEDLLTRLKRFTAKRRRILVEESSAFQDWLLCVRLCDESERAAAHSAQEALEWATLAREIARRVPGPDSWRSRLGSFAEPFHANALRVANEYQAARDAFAHARQLWKEDGDDAGLLDQGRLIDLEASLYRDQRDFNEAIKCHDKALEVAWPDQIGVILLNKAATLQERGTHEAAIEVLQEAAHRVDGSRQPRLLFGVRFNLAANLIRLDRAQEALPIVAEVRELAERLQNDLDLIRTRWLEGNALACLGRHDEAIVALEEVSRDFVERKLPFDYALASLDLAQVYLKEERLAEVGELAVEMLEIFESLKVQREAVAALLLFRDATAKGAVTEGLVRRLQDYLSKARANPKLRFEV